jgi:hypothetical protein
MDHNNILKTAEEYQQLCQDMLLKTAVIKKLPNGKYRVLSEKGRNLGTYRSRDQAKKRLKQVEFFKHLDDDDKAEDQSTIIDLSDLEELSYSALLRKLRQKASDDCIREFLKLYKKEFDRAVKNKLQKPDRIAIQNSLIALNKVHRIKINKDLVKNAAVSELGDPRLVGKYLSDIIRFTLSRISEDKRPNAINSLKHKIYGLNENDISNKNLPPSSAMGQSITFVKHVLFNHSPRYIREVLNNIVRNL